MNRDKIKQILQNRKLELKKEIEILEILKKKKTQGISKYEENIIRKVDSELLNKDKNKVYLLKHVKQAENILSKIAYLDFETRFLQYEEINFNWSTTIDMEESGFWIKGDNSITISIKYLLDEFNKYDEELIGTIQHELIHAFIDKNHNKFGLNASADSSTIHQAIITFFNFNGCNIGSNGNLANVFKREQKMLYDSCVNKEITFNQLLIKLDDWQDGLRKSIEEFNENNYSKIKEMLDKITKNEDTEDLKDVIAMFHKSCEKSYIKKIIPNDLFEKSIKDNPLFQGEFKFLNVHINLGIDCNFNNFEEFINELINDYQRNNRIN